MLRLVQNALGGVGRSFLNYFGRFSEIFEKTKFINQKLSEIRSKYIKYAQLNYTYNS